MISKGRITQLRTGRAVVSKVHQYNSQYINNATKGKVSSNALLEHRKFGKTEKPMSGRRGKAVYGIRKGFAYAKVAHLGELHNVNPLIKAILFPSTEEQVVLGNNTNRKIIRTASKVSKHAEQINPYNKKKRQKEVLSSQVSVPSEDSEVLHEILNSIDEKIRKGLTDKTLLKMITFIIKEIYTNKDIENAETEKKFDILLSLFYNKFKDVLERHTIILPIFLNYLIKTIKKVIVPSDKEDDRETRKGKG